MENLNTIEVTTNFQPNGSYWLVKSSVRKDFLDDQVMKVMINLTNMKTQVAWSAQGNNHKIANPKVQRQQLASILDYTGVFAGGKHDGLNLSESIKRLISTGKLVRFERGGKVSVAIPSPSGSYASYFS